MGMPISSYAVLSALADGRDSYEMETAQRALRPFNLFAFIVHDPEAHPRFHGVLARQFDRLDFVTGHRLLFFALVDPPVRWLDHGNGRDYYKLLARSGEADASWEAGELLNPKHAPVSADKSITAFSLANALRIPTDDLPCIVVTQGFQLNRFVWFRTSHDHVEEQLIRLGYFAERSDRPMSEVSQDWSEIDLCSSYGEESLSNSLAKALSDALSFIVARTGWRKALNQARDTIARLYATIDRLKTASGEVMSEEVDRLCICLVSFLAQLNKQELPSLDEFIAIRRELLEADSFQILRTAHKVFDLLVSHQLNELVPRAEGELLDFTPGVICLAKVFEKEANLSVVHWARRELGVSLPQYFNKPQPGLIATVTPSMPGGRKIDLNMGCRGKWLPPGIGQSELACQKLSSARLPTDWAPTNWHLLLSLWKKVREKRNEAAHSELMDEASLLEVKLALQQMADDRVFERFCRMKQEYRGAASAV
ncbi:MAG: hypothetical protein NUW37_06585 [Planctomycetes bacterium]|nr:hypothetical protein [Planctomycetota bacterium]